MALPITQRLRRSRDFAQVKTQGRSYHGKLLILNVLPQGDWPHSLWGFITPKYLGGAVHRNRLRRRLRAIVAQTQRTGEGVSTSHAVVTVAKRAAAAASFADLAREWKWLAQRASILSGHVPDSPPRVDGHVKNDR